MNKIKNNTAIICAGMTQSGSTAAWNLIKFIFDEVNIEYEYAIIGSFDNLNKPGPKPRITLNEFNKNRKNQKIPIIIKIHGKVDIDYNKETDFILLSTRDLFQSTASALKKTNRNYKHIIDRNLEIYDGWKSIIDFEILFESITSNKKYLIKKLANLFEIKLSDESIYKIIHKLDNIPKDKYNEYLLTGNHIQSNGTYIHDLKNLSNECISYLNEIKNNKKYKELFV